MLTRLKVENLAVVESAEAAFEPGLNIITGETGAGKSVLLLALKAALGARISSDAVRDGAKEAKIEAEFFLPPAVESRADALLADAGLPECEDGLLLIRRTLSPVGAGRARVNDAATTVSTLRALGALLADIHGPQDNHTLLLEPVQRNLLDAFGGIDHPGYSDAWRRLADLRAELAQLESAAPAFGIDALRFTVEELRAAAIDETDDTDLPSRHAAAAHAAQIIELSTSVVQSLDACDLPSAISSLREIARYHAPAAEWLERAKDISTEIQELLRDVSSSASGIDTDEDLLATLDERLSLVQRLKRKYGLRAAADFPPFLATRERELDNLEHREENLRALASAIAAQEKEVLALGAELTSRRRAAASRLAAAVVRHMRDLGFRQAAFEVAFSPKSPEADGCDSISYLFAPNPGEGMRPLAEIASSGETARIMLAVKTTLASADATPTLVFDEIDANIGGETGRAVGEKLRETARHHQVIAITHLPQSAVFAQHHLLVEKHVSGGRTRTSVTPISGEARVMEISRMLGSSTSSAITHARDLLAST